MPLLTMDSAISIDALAQFRLPPNRALFRHVERSRFELKLVATYLLYNYSRKVIFNGRLQKA